MLAGHLIETRRIELVDAAEPVLPSVEQQPGQIIFQPELFLEYFKTHMKILILIGT